MLALPWTIGIVGNTFSGRVTCQNILRLLLLGVFQNPDGGAHSRYRRATSNRGEERISTDLCGDPRSLEKTHHEMGLCMMLCFK